MSKLLKHLLDIARIAWYGVYTMDRNLKRVQVYIDPSDVFLLDQIAKKLRVSRSQIIRDAVGVVAKRYGDAAKDMKQEKKDRNPLLELAGIEKSKTGDLGLRVDEIYHDD